MLGPTMLPVVGQQCCVRLYGPKGLTGLNPIPPGLFEGGAAWGDGGGGGGVGGGKCPRPITLKLLTLKLAGYFAKHIQAGGGVGSLSSPLGILKRLIIRTCPLVCN